MSSYADFLATKQCAPPAAPEASGTDIDEFDADLGTSRGWHYIYGLHDPRTGELRYIGKSDNPRERLAQHLREDRGTYRASWVRHLKNAGLKPALSVIDAGDRGSDWAWMERLYIAAARASGARLTNITDGGEGTRGLPPETLKRMADARRGTKQSEATKAKRSASLKGRRHTAEWIEQQRQIMAGRKPSKACMAAVRLKQEKLKPDQVREIRRRIATGERRLLIAAEYGVSVGTISNVWTRRTYGHVTDLEPNDGR